MMPGPLAFRSVVLIMHAVFLVPSHMCSGVETMVTVAVQVRG